ncbi:MAG: GUN4 domain-containing protein [Dolichospermum sp. BR01]|nr:GUN4 domain-containing protein [Dolichospermum sp. BR01]
MTKLKVTVAGGGPVGLIFALLLKELIPSDSLSIKIYDGRWCKNTANSPVSWQSIIEGNARRQQVVTLQSKQYLQLPQTIQERIFTENSYSEMWPVLSGFMEGYRPRNVRIAHIENVLLEIANQTECIELIPTKFNAEKIDIKDQHLLVICEGSGSKTREKFIKKFGKPDTSIYSLDGSNSLKDTVLGLKVKSNLSDPEAVILTIAQNRFLLNSLNGEGFLNIRLTDEETKSVKGIKYDEDNSEFEIKGCIQSQPCLMELSNDGTYKCNTHGSIFLPAVVKNPLWGRIEKALKLFDINKEDLKAITSFNLEMSQTPRFTAQLYPPTEKTPGTFGCLLGDAANAIHFWPGRGLNSGIDSAVSLARCLHSKWQNVREGEIKFRDADFLRHEGIMAMLQYRQKSRAWHSMVVTEPDGSVGAINDMERKIEQILTNIDNSPQESIIDPLPDCNVRAIKDKIQDAINYSEKLQGNNDDIDANIQELISRLTNIKNRLQGRIIGTLPDDDALTQLLANIDDETLRILVTSNQWNTNDMAGEEVNVDLLFERKESSPGLPNDRVEYVSPPEEELIKQLFKVEHGQALDIIRKNRKLLTKEFLQGMEQIAIIVQNPNMMKLLRSARKEFQLGTMSASANLTVLQDYQNLEFSLKNKSWKEADEITTNIILKLLKRESQGQLDLEIINDLPCTDLHTINNLWAYYSENHFGFGIQKSIWDKVSRQTGNDEETYNKFCQTIGWFDENNKLCPVNHSIRASKGHLPSGRTGNIALFLQIGQRFGMPNITRQKTIRLITKFGACLISADPTGQPDC